MSAIHSNNEGIRIIAREFAAICPFIRADDQDHEHPTPRQIAAALERFEAADDPDMAANIRCTLRAQRQACAA
jgi:hypothetical protein